MSVFKFNLGPKCDVCLIENTPNRYTPGQRLNSAAEVIDALRDGQKLSYPSGRWFHLREDGHVYGQDGKRHTPNLLNPYSPWHIYTPPKRKVKSERWFAITSGPKADQFEWWNFSSEQDAKKFVPNAIAYHYTTVEVEVEG